MDFITILVISYFVLGFFTLPFIWKFTFTYNDSFGKWLISCIFHPLTLLTVLGKYFGEIVSDKIDKID